MLGAIQEYILYVFFIAGGFMCVFIGLIAFYRIKFLIVEHQTVKYRDKHHVYLEYVLSHLDSGQDLKLPASPLKRAELRVIRDAILDYSDRFSGIDRTGFVKLCTELGITSKEKRRLRSWRHSTRVSAAYQLGRIRDKSVARALVRALRRGKLNNGSYVIAAAVARCTEDIKCLLQISQFLLKNHNNNHQIVADTLGESAIDLTDLYGDFIKSDSVDLIKVALIAMVSKNTYGMTGPLQGLVYANDKEVRIKAMKVVISQGLTSSDGNLTNLVTHSDWEVRALLAKLLGEMKTVDHIPLLKTLLNDESWWVRYNSAHSLLRLRGPGYEALCDIVQSEADKYAAEMALSVINEELQAKVGTEVDEQTVVGYNRMRYVSENYVKAVV